MDDKIIAYSLSQTSPSNGSIVFHYTLDSYLQKARELGLNIEAKDLPALAELPHLTFTSSGMREFLKRESR